MVTQYKVKSGDALGKIAKQYGVSLNDISGYRSGNPNLIYEGETISIGGGNKNSKADDYSSALKDGLSEYDETSSFNSSDPYGVEKYKTDYDTYKTNRDSAYNNLKGLTQSTFDSEYEKSGLAEKKAQIEKLNDDIAIERQKRDDAIAKVRSNPGLSASQMTGDIKKLTDYQNNVINNLISERNGVASECNDGIAEIDKTVQNTLSDARLDYQYWDDLLGETGTLIDRYSQVLRDELAGERDQENFDKQLAQALQIAQMKSSDSGSSSQRLQLITDDNTGDPLYWFNPYTFDRDWESCLSKFT